MSDDEGYAPAAQMLICFIFPASVRKNTDSDDRCQEVPGRIPAPTVQEEESVVASAPEPARDPTVERRRRARAKVSFFACVKTAQFGPDIVTCLDISKGGVSFRSRNPYKKEMKIQIAVPYASEVKNAPSIFVSGRITNVREMEGMWKCGVEFFI